MNWGQLYSRIITEIGWTTKEIDETPWPDLLDLLCYWVDNPSHGAIFRAIACAVGVEFKQPAQCQVDNSFTPKTDADMRNLVNLFKGGGHG